VAGLQNELPGKAVFDGKLEARIVSRAAIVSVRLLQIASNSTRTFGIGVEQIG
jgi:hypothetical protein